MQLTSVLECMILGSICCRGGHFSAPITIPVVEVYPGGIWEDGEQLVSVRKREFS